MSKFHLLTQQRIEEIMLHPFVFQAPISVFLFWFITKWLRKSAGKKNFPPSPPKLPLIGNLHQLSSFPHHYFRSLAKKYGQILLIHFGSWPTLVISSAAAAREIMKTQDLTFADRPDLSVDRRLLYGNKDVSIAPYGEYWRQLKSIVVLQLVSNKRVRSFHSVREEETALLMKKIRESSGPVNLSKMIGELAYDVICRSAFGMKYREGESGQKFLSLLGEFLEVLGTFSIGDFVPCLSWINRVTGFDKRVDKVSKGLDAFLEEVIEERLKTPTEKAARDKNGENFLDILLDIYKNNNTGVTIDRDNIKAIILDVFAAGSDTTSTVLEWAMTELLRHPIMMKKLQKEVREIVRDKQNITAHDMEQMHYLKSVLKETVRYHTPIPLLVPRRARTDAKVMGYDVAAGTMVFINAAAIGRDPTSWDEPEKFDPDRFLNSSIDFKGVDFELIPFGAGRRLCPGLAFAMANNELVLANLVQKFDWKLPDEGKDLDMSEKPGVVIGRAVPLVAVATPYHS